MELRIYLSNPQSNRLYVKDSRKLHEKNSYFKNPGGSCGLRTPKQPKRLLEGAGDLVRVPERLLKGIYRLPQRDLWGLGFRVYLEGQGT